MNIQTIMSFFGMLLILCLVGMGVVKIWAPETISNETFVKLVVTFGLLTGGSILMSLLSKAGNSLSKDEGKKEE